MDTPTALTALAALAQPHRLAIYRWLLVRGPDGAFAGEIAGALGLAATTQSFHLKALAQAGLIAALPEGRHIRYRAEVEAVRGLVGYLTENCCGGDPSLCLPEPRPGKAACC